MTDKQLTLPGVNPPLVPDSFSGYLSYYSEEYPYIVIFSHDEPKISFFWSDSNKIIITACAVISPVEVKRILFRDREKIVRNLLNERLSLKNEQKSGTFTYCDISVPYTIDYNPKKRVNSVSYYRNGKLVIEVRVDASLEDINQTLHEYKDWIYRQVMKYDPKYRKDNVEDFISIGHEKVKILITYSSRAKRMTLKVFPTGPITIVCPLDAVPQDARRFAMNNAVWIAKQLGKFNENKTDEHQRFIHTGDSDIQYTIRFSERAKRMVLKILPDKSIVIVAPRGISPDIAHSYVQANSNWLLEKLKQDTKPAAPKRLYLDGEPVLLLGREIPLRVHKQGKIFDAIKREDTIEIMIPENLPESHYRNSIIRVLEYFFEKTLRDIVPDITRIWCTRLNIPIPKISYRNQKTRWGVCTKNGIILNIRLAMAPLDIIEYVIVHELCHIHHPNHSKSFWALVEKMLPNYVKTRARLKHESALFTF